MQTLAQSHQTKWNRLSDPWKAAFNMAVLQRAPDAGMPPDDQLKALFSAQALRFAGPTAPYPNMNFELQDLSGLQDFKQVEILVVSHHAIRSLEEIAALKQIKSLFVFDNQLAQLDGIEGFTDLHELYCQNNHIRSLKPLEQLTGLKKLYCSGNLLSTLEGIGKQHAAMLEHCYCLPNGGLRDTEILRFETETGIRCLKG